MCRDEPSRAFEIEPRVVVEVSCPIDDRLLDLERAITRLNQACLADPIKAETYKARAYDQWARLVSLVSRLDVRALYARAGQTAQELPL